MKNLVFFSVAFFALLNPWNLIWAQALAYTFKFGTDSDSEVATDMVPYGQGILVCGNTNYDPGEGSASRAFVFRLNASGQPDITFGNGGVVFIDFPNSNDQVYAIALNSAGDIFLAGNTDGGYTGCIFKLKGSDGSLATNFGTGGRVKLINAGKFEDVIILPNQKIVAVGWGLAASSTKPDYIVAQYNATGQLDTSFGTDNGFSLVNFEDDDFGKSVVRQSDGALVVAGESWTCSSASCNDFSITRLFSNGQPDNGFGKKLYKTSPQTSSVMFKNLSLHKINAEERLLMSGINDIDIFLYRIRDNGNPDATFGSNGFKTYPQLGLGGYHSLQADGKVLIISDLTTVGILRALANGTPDNTFGTNGLFSFSTGGTFFAKNIMVSDNAIYVVGEVANGAVTDAFVIKVNNNFVSVESPDATAIGLEIFPNPSTGNATIRFNSGESGPAQLRLFDLAGRLVHQTSIALQDGEIQSLDLSLEGRLSPGNYMLQIQTAHRFANKKWVVERR